MSSDGLLEASDMNDGEILNKTTQIPCKGGHSFKYVLPDGHEITSECIPPDHKKKALHIWVDVVKQTAVARAKSEREELAAKIRRQKADANPAMEASAAAAMGLILVQEGGPSVKSSAASSGTPQNPVLPVIEQVAAHGTVVDPIVMAQGGLVNASLEVQQLAPRLYAAQQRVKQWQAVLQALKSVELPKESSVIDTGPYFNHTD